jgi:hypothetical protein
MDKLISFNVKLWAQKDIIREEMSLQVNAMIPYGIVNSTSNPIPILDY